VLVRRVKQGVAEWFRLQLEEKCWKGLLEHSLAGWNIGFVPYRFLADRIPPKPLSFKILGPQAHHDALAHHDTHQHQRDGTRAGQDRG